MAGREQAQQTREKKHGSNPGTFSPDDDEAQAEDVTRADAKNSGAGGNPGAQAGQNASGEEAEQDEEVDDDDADEDADDTDIDDDEDDEESPIGSDDADDETDRT